MNDGVANVQNGGEQLYIKTGNIGFSVYSNGAYQVGTDIGISNGVRYSVMGSYDGNYIKNKCNAEIYKTE